ncbi:hypothetical protein X975_21638, partial [Stegodyphus mimosarum]
MASTQRWSCVLIVMVLLGTFLVGPTAGGHMGGGGGLGGGGHHKHG